MIACFPLSPLLRAWVTYRWTHTSLHRRGSSSNFPHWKTLGKSFSGTIAWITSICYQVSSYPPLLPSRFAKSSQKDTRIKHIIMTKTLPISKPSKTYTFTEKAHNQPPKAVLSMRTREKVPHTAYWVISWTNKRNLTGSCTFKKVRPRA